MRKCWRSSSIFIWHSCLSIYRQLFSRPCKSSCRRMHKLLQCKYRSGKFEQFKQSKSDRIGSPSDIRDPSCNIRLLHRSYMEALLHQNRTPQHMHDLRKYLRTDVRSCSVFSASYYGSCKLRYSKLPRLSLVSSFKLRRDHDKLFFFYSSK